MIEVVHGWLIIISMFPLFRKQRDFNKLINPIRLKLKTLGVRQLGFFGSYSRGEDRAGSDIDVLLDFEESARTYDNLWEVREALQSIFKKKKIDLVTMDGLSPYIGPKILQTVKYVDLGN